MERVLISASFDKRRLGHKAFLLCGCGKAGGYDFMSLHSICIQFIFHSWDYKYILFCGVCYNTSVIQIWKETLSFFIIIYCCQCKFTGFQWYETWFTDNLPNFPDKQINKISKLLRGLIRGYYKHFNFAAS